MTHSASRFDSVFSEIVGVLPIRIYQKTLGQVLPDSCRYYPTCSQYGVIAVRRFGLWRGLDLTARRIRRCHRPNGGYDPVPQVYEHSGRSKRSSVRLTNEDATPIKGSVKGNYSTVYRLIFAIPYKDHSFTKETLASHIDDFKKEVVNNQYTILYDLTLFEVGIVKEHIVFRAAGTVDKSLTERGYSSFEELFLTQINTYLGLDKNGFRVVYAEYDGEVTTKPRVEEPVALEYKSGTSFWSYSSNRSFWDSYWDAYIITEAVEGGCDLLEGCDGCDLPDFDGCNLEGCDLNGCDGCDLGGCDASGCDSSGCDMSASLSMISNFTRSILRLS